MSRRELREQLFKLLFRIEFNAEEEMPQQEEFFLEEEEIVRESDRKQLDAKFHNILEKLEEIDRELNERVSGWNTGRMGKVDLTILRLAVYEIEYDEDIPTGVAINEAVELAKLYCNDDAPSFINGLLAHFVRKDVPAGQENVQPEA